MGRAISPDIVDRVSARLRRFLDAGEGSILLDDEAETDVRQLTEYVGERPDDAGAVRALAWFRWDRYLQLTDVDTATDELVEAIRWFRVLRPHDTSLDPVFVWMVDTPVADAVVARAYAMAQRANRHCQRAREGDADAREIVIDMLTSATRMVPEDNPNHTAWLEDLVVALGGRAEHTTSVADLAEAIRIEEAIVTASRARGTLTVTSLANLGLLLSTRGSWHRSIGDIERGIGLLDEAGTLEAATSTEKELVSANLAAALIHRHYLTSDVDDLEKATRVLATSADATEGTFIRPYVEAFLSFERFGKTGDLTVLDSSIAAFRDALDRVPANDLSRMAVVIGLAEMLATRFEHTGSGEDLDNGIDLIRGALTSLPPGHGYRRDALVYLCAAHIRRFYRDGSLLDLDLAITSGRMATDNESDQRGAILAFGNLASALSTRFQVLADVRDLDAAIAARHKSVEFDEPSSAGRATNLGNLAVELFARYRMTGNCTDLERAIATVDHALVSPHPRFYRHRIHATRCVLFAARFEHSGQRIDVAEAVASVETAIAMVADDHPDRANLLGMLGVVSSVSGVRNADRGAVRRAVDLFWSATRIPSAPTHIRLRCARFAAMAASELGAHRDSLRAYQLSIDLLPRRAWHGLARTDRERFLVETTGLAGRACEAALLAGRPERAVELLDAGRGLLWSQILDLRTDLTRLREAMPDMAERLDAIRRRLDTPSTMQADVMSLPVWTAPSSEDRAALARDWDTLLDQVRSRPGFADFLRRPTFDSLADAANGGPVAIINCGQNRCDALLLTDGHVEVLPLPAATAANHNTVGESFLGALRVMHTTGVVPPTLVATAERMITVVLAWLWHAIAQPVLDHLGFREPTTELPRMWWCMTGPLSILPIHAAGLDPVEYPGANVLDRTVSSYTTTVGALRQARERFVARHPVGKLLLVSPTDLDSNLPVLSGGQREAEFLGSIVRNRLHRLTGSDATMEQVRNELPGHRIFHFGGHAVQDLDHPWQGGLLLADGFLTVSDLSHLRPADGALAFLAACQTATSGTALPDENINLVSAVQCAGYQQVIGTLWPVLDAPAAFVTRQVYRRLVRDDHIDLSDTAAALHHAVRRLRRRHLRRPTVWAPFIHIGP